MVSLNADPVGNHTSDGVDKPIWNNGLLSIWWGGVTLTNGSKPCHFWVLAFLGYELPPKVPPKLPA